MEKKKKKGGKKKSMIIDQRRWLKGIPALPCPNTSLDGRTGVRGVLQPTKRTQHPARVGLGAYGNEFY